MRRVILLIGICLLLPTSARSFTQEVSARFEDDSRFQGTVHLRADNGRIYYAHTSSKGLASFTIPDDLQGQTGAFDFYRSRHGVTEEFLWTADRQNLGTARIEVPIPSFRFIAFVVNPDSLDISIEIPLDPPHGVTAMLPGSQKNRAAWVRGSSVWIPDASQTDAIVRWVKQHPGETPQMTIRLLSERGCYSCARKIYADSENQLLIHPAWIPCPSSEAGPSLREVAGSSRFLLFAGAASALAVTGVIANNQIEQSTHRSDAIPWARGRDVAYAIAGTIGVGTVVAALARTDWFAHETRIAAQTNGHASLRLQVFQVQF